MGQLYLLTSPSGKQYVGITASSLERRWKQHCYDARHRNTPLYAAIRKYGAASFALEVLLEGSWEDLNAAEELEIAARRTQHPNGYNLRAGGNQSALHPDTCQKLSQIRRGRRSPAQLAASAARRGRPLVQCVRANTGRVVSAETRARMSAAHRGKQLSQKQREYHESRRGRPLSEAHRENIRTARKRYLAKESA